MVTYWDFINCELFTVSYLFVTIAFLVLAWKIISPFLGRHSGIPGPKGNIITGHLLQILYADDVLKIYEEWRRTYGPIVEYRPLGIFGARHFLITDPDSIKQVLVTNAVKYERPTPRKDIPIIRNVVFATGKEHARQRKMLNPAFKVSNLKGMVDIFEQKARLLVQVWGDTIHSHGIQKECTLPVQNDMTHLTLDAVGEGVFGYQFNSLTNKNNIISATFEKFLRGMNLRGDVFKMWPILRNIPTPGKIREAKAREITNDVIDQMVREKRDRQKNPAEDSLKRKDLLDLLMEAFDENTGEHMSEVQLRSQVFAFMIAGHETSSVALSWTLYFLASYPEVQDKLRREIEKSLQNNELEWDVFESMEYLNAVVNESLRLRPPAVQVRRSLVEEDTLLGHTIPQGSVVTMPQYLLHRHPKYWKDPEVFNPNRFYLPDKGDNPSNRFAFFPFGGGPRICIGYRFALMEIKVVLSILVQNFAFSMIPGRSVKGAIAVTYKPSPPLELLVRKV